MELSPKVYHWFARPKWFFNSCIGNILCSNFNFNNKTVLDFGCGIGSCCFMLNSSSYIGIDCDSRRIDYAKRLYPDYKFNIIKENKIPVDDNLFDYVLIISVLHHISSENMTDYIKELHRVINDSGKIIIIEPCLFERSYINNHFMTFLDRGNYIRNEHEYLGIFRKYFYTELLKKYNQLFLYNKILFTATPKYFVDG